MILRTFTPVAAASFALSGTALAQDAMPARMAGDAMAPMDADQTLADCPKKAEMETDMIKKDDATKACHDEHKSMGTPAMGNEAMAPATDPMGRAPTSTK